MDQNIARRTLLSAAWAAPVVVLAVGAPAFATSAAQGALDVSFSPQFFDDEGNFGSFLTVTNQASSTMPAAAVLVRVTNNAGVEFLRADRDTSVSGAPVQVGENIYDVTTQRSLAPGESTGDEALALHYGMRFDDEHFLSGATASASAPGFDSGTAQVYFSLD